MMRIRNNFKITALSKVFFLLTLIFVSSPSHATYYGGHHYKHHSGHYGHINHRPHYNYHRNHHRRYGVHHGVHARLNDTAAYVVLGVLGIALLSHIFSDDNSQYKNTYPQSYPNSTPVNVISPREVVYQKPINHTSYKYNENEGWERLSRGNVETALDIFAVQSQQNLNSGKYKIGFALAAAAKGEKQRAILAMRKAVRIDIAALDSIYIHELESNIRNIVEDYKSSINKSQNKKDIAFMIATLSYLQKDYETARLYINESDQNLSTNLVRSLISKKL
jgi:tetratricopeptide (TPR) repeat protein